MRQLKKTTIFLFISLFYFSVTFSQSNLAFAIKEKDLFPEGIAWDPVEKIFYISSILKNKIVEVSGNITKDFIKEGEDGFMGGAGLHVDSKRRILWACTGNIRGNKYRTGIFAWDLKTKRLLKKISFAEDTVATFFNDLAIAPTGEIYITNTAEGCVYKWSLQMDKPEKLVFAEKLSYPNGIVVLPGNKNLIVATSKGLVKISLQEKAVHLLSMPDSSVSKGLDGLVFYKHSIIGVFNATFSKEEYSVIQYNLSKDNDRIIKADTIVKGHRYFDIPTTAVVAGNDLYVIANSQLDNLDQVKLLVIKQELLTDNFILRFRLKQ